MYFLLSKKDRVNGKKPVWFQMGIVVAEDQDEAIKKLNGLAETSRIIRPTGKSAGVFISLEDKKGNEYFLESCREISSLPE